MHQGLSQFASANARLREEACAHCSLLDGDATDWSCDRFVRDVVHPDRAIRRLGARRAKYGMWVGAERKWRRMIVWQSLLSRCCQSQCHVWCQDTGCTSARQGRHGIGFPLEVPVQTTVVTSILHMAPAPGTV